MRSLVSFVLYVQRKSSHTQRNSSYKNLHLAGEIKKSEIPDNFLQEKIAEPVVWISGVAKRFDMSWRQKIGAMREKYACIKFIWLGNQREYEIPIGNTNGQHDVFVRSYLSSTWQNRRLLERQNSLNIAWVSLFNLEKMAGL